MKRTDPDEPAKPHSIWPGLMILGVLLLVVLGGLLSGSLDGWSALAFLALTLLVALAAFSAAFIASLIRDERRVASATRVLCALFVTLVALAAYPLASAVGRALSRDAFWPLLLVFFVVGNGVAPFVAAYGVYRHARRSGKTHQEAQRLSRWGRSDVGDDSPG